MQFVYIFCVGFCLLISVPGMALLLQFLYLFFVFQPLGPLAPRIFLNISNFGIFSWVKLLGRLARFWHFFCFGDYFCCIFLSNLGSTDICFF